MTTLCKRLFLEPLEFGFLMQIKASEFTELIMKEMKRWNDSGHICKLTLSWKAPFTHIRIFLKPHLYILFTWIGLPSGTPSTRETNESSHRDRTGTSADDGKARGKDWTRLPVLNLLLCHYLSQLFDLRASSSTDVPVLLLNKPTIFLKPLSGVV